MCKVLPTLQGLQGTAQQRDKPDERGAQMGAGGGIPFRDRFGW
jgi:hypothetical protein